MVSSVSLYGTRAVRVRVRPLVSRVCACSAAIVVDLHGAELRKTLPPAPLFGGPIWPYMALILEGWWRSYGCGKPGFQPSLTRTVKFFYMAYHCIARDAEHSNIYGRSARYTYRIWCRQIHNNKIYLLLIITRALWQGTFGPDWKFLFVSIAIRLGLISSVLR